ncbi:uncharacterized protein LOC107636628 [Arachis ipaensis]|uniref:uncharacterized protein LOC107636628 n=1 Tax=Arachis ipaensis TaxID=130454 RepID=UPI0007AEEFB9|nr:uncharacterized protein LOC107636628 [Arachis ipaensis]
MFAFTSFGGKILNSINDGRGPPQFIVTGQNYHRIGSLLPNAGEKPKFAQLYVYDTAHEVNNGQSFFSHTFDIDTDLIVRLLHMIDEHNVIAKSFRRVREFHEYHPSEVYSLRLFCQRRSDRRVYNFPSCDEIAALIVGDFDSSDQGRDIILRSVDGQLRRIYETHPLYWPLQYPLLFPYGEDGFEENIPYRGVQNINIRGRRTKVSLREFICFRLQMREIEESIIHKSRRLFGPDRVTATISNVHVGNQNTRVLDEIKELTFHLPNQQHIIFDDRDTISSILVRNKDLVTMFIAWMLANRVYPEGKDLTYVEFPRHFVYVVDNREWKPRQRGFSIGRLSFVPPTAGELFYMRLLLNVQRGCTSFKSIRTVNGTTYDTFQEAYFALGLLTDDNEFVEAIKEAALLGTALTVTPEELQTFCLIEIEKLLQNNGKSLKDYAGMPLPNVGLISTFSNSMVVREMQYDVSEMLAQHDDYFAQLTAEQESIYHAIISRVCNKEHGFFFVYGFGGIGKTFLYKTLSTKLQSERKIVINVTSSGIASLLLPGGKTAHSMFNIPIELNEESVCRIRVNSQKADLIRQADLIIWDEAPMTNKLAFEAVDRTFRDLMKVTSISNQNLPFGGKVIVLGGDFRQVLPVIPKASRAEIVMASINSSYLWKHCEVFNLTRNMRLESAAQNSDMNELRLFSEWILQVGEGKCGTRIDDRVFVKIASELLIPITDDPIIDIVSVIYPNLSENLNNSTYFQDRAILAATIEIVEEINDHIVNLLPGEMKEYLSSDCICGTDANVDIDLNWINVEFLNQIKCSGLPNHSLKLKVGAPVILLRNIDPAGGLCNGTRLIVHSLGRNVITADIVSGSNVGDRVFISRMNLIPSDSGLPFKFQHR